MRVSSRIRHPQPLQPALDMGQLVARTLAHSFVNRIGCVPSQPHCRRDCDNEQGRSLLKSTRRISFLLDAILVEWCCAIWASQVCVVEHSWH